MNYSWSHVTSYFRVKETKRQGRIAHHHTDATVPHIVALLGFSFHVAKIRQVSETSKLYGDIFITTGIVHLVRLDSNVTLFRNALFSSKCPKTPQKRHFEFS